MGKTTANPWLVEQVDPVLVERLAARHVPNSQAVEMGVDIVSNPHREDDEGLSWARLSDARYVEDVVPGSAVVMGSSIGRYLAKVAAWDFEVSDDDPIVSLELLPVRPSEVAKLLERSRTSAA
jgi:hypothetical protein